MLDNNDSRAKVVIVGSGAVGGLFGHRLSHSAFVAAVCRSNYAAVSKNGFSIESDDYGNATFIPDRVYQSIQQAGEDEITYDYVVVTLKNVPEAGQVADLIQPLIKSPKVAIVLIQNGVEIEHPVKERYPENLLISAVTTIMASQLDHGKIVHRKGVTHIGMGEFPIVPQVTTAKDDLQNDPRTIAFKKLFDLGQVSCEIVPNIQALRWYKIQWNGVLSPLGILTGGCDTYEMLQCPELKQLVRDAMTEVRSLGESYTGCPLPSWIPVPDQEALINVTKDTRFKSSLLLDFQRQYSLELEVTLGNLVRISHQINHPIPLVKAFYAMVKIADQKNRNLIPPCPTDNP